MSQRKIDYNKRKAAQYGWTPDWFGCTAHDQRLVNAIQAFQTEEGLDADGMCGPTTFRRIWTRREEARDDVQIDTVSFAEYIIYNGARVKIFWDKVLTYNEPGGRKAGNGKYTSYAGKPPRNPSFFVTHWDVCLNSNSCYKVLEKRGISVHFGIDNDGTIFQWLDMQHAGWHAGGRTWNHKSVGVEISNAYSLKYQSWYERKGFGPRPVMEGAKVHGKTCSTHLGFYDVQLEALAALWEAVSYATGIPLALPSTDNAVDPDCVRGDFKGFCNHYHLTKRKIDCASLDNDKVLRMALQLRERRYQV